MITERFKYNRAADATTLVMPTTPQRHTDTDSSFKIGFVVRIQGLQNQSDLNEQWAVIKQYHADQGRYEVMMARGKNTLGVKPSNLTKENMIQSTDASFKQDKYYNHVVFWPSINNSIPVQAFPDWPEPELQHCEEDFLK